MAFAIASDHYASRAIARSSNARRRTYPCRRNPRILRTAGRSSCAFANEARKTGHAGSSRKKTPRDEWHHSRIVLACDTLDEGYEDIVLDDAQAGELQILGEYKGTLDEPS